MRALTVGLLAAAVLLAGCITTDRDRHGRRSAVDAAPALSR